MKRLIQNRRSAGWNLIEIIVAVAIGASIAAAGVVAYQGEAKKAAVAKAKTFISQIESKKAVVLADASSADNTAPLPADEPSLAALILPDMKVQGQSVGSDEGAAAAALGFQSVSVGTLDVLKPDGTLQQAGTPASVTLKNNGGTITGNQSNTSSASGS